MAVAAAFSGNGNEGAQDECERKKKRVACHSVIVAKNRVLSRLVENYRSVQGRGHPSLYYYSTILNTAQKDGTAHSICDILFSRGNEERETTRTICSHGDA